MGNKYCLMIRGYSSEAFFMSKSPRMLNKYIRPSSMWRKETQTICYIYMYINDLCEFIVRHSKIC